MDNSDPRLKMLIEEISSSLNNAEFLRKREDFLSKVYGLMAVVLSAAVTVASGVKINNFPPEIISNITLILGGCLTIINAFMVIVDFRKKANTHTIATYKLRSLLRDVKFHTLSGSAAAVNEEKLVEFKNRYDMILDDEVNELTTNGKTEKS